MKSRMLWSTLGFHEQSDTGLNLLFDFASPSGMSHNAPEPCCEMGIVIGMAIKTYIGTCRNWYMYLPLSPALIYMYILRFTQCVSHFLNKIKILRQFPWLQQQRSIRGWGVEGKVRFSLISPCLDSTDQI